MLHATDSAVRQLYQIPLCLIDTSGRYPELAVYAIALWGAGGLRSAGICWYSTPSEEKYFR